MIEYVETVEKWWKSNKKIALVRVIKTWGSSPRPMGSIMLVNEDGHMAGSVSGGCVEGAVVKRSQEVLAKGQPLQLDFGVSDEEAWSVGLSCGGRIQLYVEPMDPEASPVWEQLIENIHHNIPSILISALEKDQNTATLLGEDDQVIGAPISDGLLKEAKQAYHGRTHTSTVADEKAYFIHLFPRKAQLLIIGAAHITVDLVSLGSQFGFETIVIDPRGYFTQHTTFDVAPDQLLEAYPSEVLPNFPIDAYTYAAILSHDPKIDDDALETLLPKEVAYIGALGSRKTHEKRKKRLLEKGIAQELIDKINAPIGVTINARSAREIALAIMAQLIEVKNQYVKR